MKFRPSSVSLFPHVPRLASFLPGMPTFTLDLSRPFSHEIAGGQWLRYQPIITDLSLSLSSLPIRNFSLSRRRHFNM